MASGNEGRALDGSEQSAVSMAQAMIGAPEDELQRWADEQSLRDLRAWPERLREVAVEREREAEACRTIAARIQEVVAASGRGYLLGQEPTLARDPGPAMASTAERPWR